MRLRFTKMQGAGNDFVLLDATRAPLDLDAAQLRRLADRRFGVGADQILIVEPSAAPGVDFRYRIFNGASGDEVEQCGNGARCFVRFVRARGLSDKQTLVVETMKRRLELREQADGRVTVDMGAPDFEPLHVPFDTTWLAPRSVESGLPLWPVELGEGRSVTVAVGIRLGLLDAKVDVETRGGRLTIEWAGEGAPVLMTGPAETVFEGEID